MSAVDELARLRQRRSELVKTIHDGESALTFADGGVEEARQALAQAERERLGGGDPEAVTKAERRLAAARKAAATDTTREKLAGARAALRDADAEIGRFAAAHYADLRDAVNAEAVAVAARVDAALVELATAHRERALLAARAAEVFTLVGRVHPRTIPLARADIERLARDAEAATMRGPEVATGAARLVPARRRGTADDRADGGDVLMTDPIIEALRSKPARRAALTRLIAEVPPERREPDYEGDPREPDDESRQEDEREQPDDCERSEPDIAG